MEFYYLESVRNDATVFLDISNENMSAKIPTRCFSGTLPHSLTRTCSLFWGWLPFSGNKGMIWESLYPTKWYLLRLKSWKSLLKRYFSIQSDVEKMHLFYLTIPQVMISREVKVPFQFFNASPSLIDLR